MDGEQLDLSADVIAGIYAGDITNWNDPAIANDNPGADLPDLRIVPVHRYDTSGTTENFTEYLSAAAPEVWTYGEYSNWSENGPAGEGAVYSGGTAQVVASAAGAFVLATTVSSADGQDLAVEFDRVPTSSSAYPLAMLSYTVVCLQYEDVATANLVGSYLYFVQTDEAQQIASATAGAVQLDAKTTDWIHAISESMCTTDPSSEVEPIV